MIITDKQGKQMIIIIIMMMIIMIITIITICTKPVSHIEWKHRAL